MAEKDDVGTVLKSRHIEKRSFEDLVYVRYKSHHNGTERGTVLISGCTFPGFPHIKRIFTLEKGLLRNIPGDYVFAEEKIDGCNVRTVLVGGKIYALSRGGIIDAFCTEKARESVQKETLEGVMLCGEMVGNTPYTKPTSEYDVRYYVFDIYDLAKGAYYPPEEKYSFLKKHGLYPAPSFGRFHKSNTMKKLIGLVLDVNRANKEGIVFKSEDSLSVVKYVNPNADIEDIGQCIKALFDMPIGHFNQRLLRSSIFINEFGLSIKKYGAQLGEAVYSNMARGISMLEKEGQIYEEFEICIFDRFIFDELKHHMSKEIRLEIISEKKEGRKIRIRFKKIYIKTTKRLKEFLNGKGITD